MTASLEAPSLGEIRDAAARLQGIALRTPLVRLNADVPGGVEVWLKLESLQPIGSFKLRGAAYAMLTTPRSMLERGVYTASAGNMAQGVAWVARELGVPCTVIVPEHAPATKLAAVERLGGRLVRVSFDRWWQVMREHAYPGLPGLFVHPVSDRRVMAGNGTVGLEIFEELGGRAPDAVLVPYGGGGLSVGIAAAARALSPGTRVYGCEVETAAPLRASLAAGQPVEADYAPSFVDGIGGRSVLAEMWPLVREMLAGALAVSVAEVAAAVRLLVERNRVVAEGAGAAGVAAALRGIPRTGEGEGEVRRIVCVVSGGNIDTDTLVRILGGAVPER